METYRSENESDHTFSSRSQNTNSHSKRTELISSYEHKYIERKREHKKKKNNKKSNNLFSIDEQLRVKREAEREARRKEMETWIPDPEILKKAEQAHRRRSMHIVQDIMKWYGKDNEVDVEKEIQSTTASTSFLPSNSTTTNQITRSQSLPTISPLSSTLTPSHNGIISDNIVDQSQQLEQHLSELKSKLDELEQQTASNDVHLQRTGYLPHRKKRLNTRMNELAPIGHENIPRAQSSGGFMAPHSLRGNVHRSIKTSMGKRGTSINSNSFSTLYQKINQIAYAPTEQEESKEAEIFLSRFKLKAKQEGAVLIIQSFWRMCRSRAPYLRWIRTRRKYTKRYFQTWLFSFKVRKRIRHALLRKILHAWSEDVKMSFKLCSIELKLFRECAMQKEVPNIVVNLFFTSIEKQINDDDRNQEQKNNTNEKETVADMTNALSAASFPSVGLFSSTFTIVEEQPLSNSEHMNLKELKRLHQDAKNSIGKKITQRMFLRWKKVHEKYRRIGLNAQLCIRRAVRLAFDSRRIWTREKMLDIFEIWARWAAFNRCKRLSTPMPHFQRPLPRWDLWVYKYQERYIRKAKAGTKAPFAKLRRCFGMLKSHVRDEKQKRHDTAISKSHFERSLLWKVINMWRLAIAEDAWNRKTCRKCFLKFAKYTKIKRKLQPRKEKVKRLHAKNGIKTAWKVWKYINLRSNFKRQFTLIRLEEQLERHKVQKSIFLWLNVRSQIMKWKLFRAWYHYVARRKLFLTILHHCTKLHHKHLLYGILNAWKSVVWKQEQILLEDALSLNAWGVYEEIAPFFPKLFRGNFTNAVEIFSERSTKITSSDSEDEIEQEISSDSENDKDNKTVNVNSQKCSTQHRQQHKEPTIASNKHDSDVVSNTKQKEEENSQKEKANQRRMKRNNHVSWYQSILAQGSLAEIRNEILTKKYLINVAEESSGNTPLHIAAQLEDSTKRVEVLSLLLSEGATTWNRKNRHGLIPRQLIPLNDMEDCKRLLDAGLFAFYSHNILKRKAELWKDAKEGMGVLRLVWCLTALMWSECNRDERVESSLLGDPFSVLLEGNWLRQERICFSSDSEFLQTSVRSYAFVDGMKRKLALRKNQVLSKQMGQMRSSILAHELDKMKRWRLMKKDTLRVITRDTAHRASSDPTNYENHLMESLIPEEERDEEDENGDGIQEQGNYHELHNPMHDKNVKIVGEYEVYGRILMENHIDFKLLERNLVLEFVNVLYGLGYPIKKILQQSFRLEQECAKIERDVLEYYEELQQLENPGSDANLSALLSSNDEENMKITSMARYFASESDIQSYFQREIFLVDVNTHLLDQAQDAEEGLSTAGDLTQETIQGYVKEIDVLITQEKRKLRKAEKKKTALEEEILTDELAYKTSIKARDNSKSGRRLLQICHARAKLETNRLCMAHILMKIQQYSTCLSKLETFKNACEKIIAPPSSQDNSQADVHSPLILDQFTRKDLSLRKKTLQKERVKCEEVFTKLQKAPPLGPSSGNRANRTPRTPRSAALSCSSNQAYDRRKQAIQALHELIVKNVLRSCCFWLAENLANDERQQSIYAENTISTSESNGTSHSMNSLLNRGKSSLSVARKVLETLQRGSAPYQLPDEEAVKMRSIYGNSTSLLFREEREAIEQGHIVPSKEQPEHNISIKAEINPITGDVEVPPTKIVDLNAIDAAIKAQEMTVHDPITEELVKLQQLKQNPRKNRKREELRVAILLGKVRSQENKTYDDTDEEEDKASPSLLDHKIKKKKVVSYEVEKSVIFGEEVEFGNFVSRNYAPSFVEFEKDQSEEQSLNAQYTEQELKRRADNMWRRKYSDLYSNISMSKIIPDSGYNVPIDPTVANMKGVVSIESKPDVRSQPQEVSRPTTEPSVEISPLQSSPEAIQNVTVVDDIHSQAEHAVEDVFDCAEEVLNETSVEISERQYAEKEEESTAEEQLTDETYQHQEHKNTIEDQEGIQQLLRGQVNTGSTCHVKEVAANDQGAMYTENVTENTEIVETIDTKGAFFAQSLMEYLEKINTGPLIEKQEIEDTSIALSTSISKKPELPHPKTTVGSSKHHEQVYSPLIKWDKSPGGANTEEDDGANGAACSLSSLQEKDVDISSLLVQHYRSFPMSSSSPSESGVDDTITYKIKYRSSLHSPKVQHQVPIEFQIQGASLGVEKRPTQLWNTSSNQARLKTANNNQLRFAKLNSKSLTEQAEQLPEENEGFQTVSVEDEVTGAPACISSEDAATVPTAVQTQKEGSPALALVQSRDILPTLDMTGWGLRQNGATTSSAPSSRVSNVPHKSKRDSDKKEKSSSMSLDRDIVIDLELIGAKMAAPKGLMQESTLLTQDIHVSSLHRTLTKQEKEAVWDDFANKPLSDAVRDAYSEIYPQMYSIHEQNRQTYSTQAINPSTQMASNGDSIRKSSSEKKLLIESSIQSTTVMRAQQGKNRELELDTKFWKAVQGYKTIQPNAILNIDDKLALQRRKKRSLSIYDEFISQTSSNKLDWLKMYPNEVDTVQQKLKSAPSNLFDSLQQTVQLRISMAVAQRKFLQETFGGDGTDKQPVECTEFY